MDIALSVKEASQCRQIILQTCRHLLQHQTLSRVVQHRNFFVPHLLQNAMAEASEAQHINIQNPASVI